MSVRTAVLGLVLFVLLPASVGIVLAWTSLKCYPWHRCGRCGWDEWRIFRRSDTPGS
jgi:hypothetical protein